MYASLSIRPMLKLWGTKVEFFLKKFFLTFPPVRFESLSGKSPGRHMSEFLVSTTSGIPQFVFFAPSVHCVSFMAISINFLTTMHGGKARLKARRSGRLAQNRLFSRNCSAALTAIEHWPVIGMIHLVLLPRGAHCSDGAFEDP